MSDRPVKGVMMSGGGKAVQEGVRVKLPKDMTWEKLAQMSPADIKEKGLFLKGFLPLAHPNHPVGGQVFPQNQIDEIQKLEKRSLLRFDVEFDLPDHLTPEFPPPSLFSAGLIWGTSPRASFYPSKITMRSYAVSIRHGWQGKDLSPPLAYPPVGGRESPVRLLVWIIR